ncbi:MAG: hypothetical protein ABIO70_36755 [Pseudomonadota bacterium]
MRRNHAVFIVLWLAPWLLALLAAHSAHAAPLVPPRPEPCRVPLADDEDDSGFSAPAGLGEEEIALAMDAFLPTLTRCIPAGRALSARPRLHLEVACTGLVQRVEVLDAGGLPPATAACIADTLHYADLPAHDAPEGFGFDYRLSLMFLTPPKRR